MWGQIGGGSVKWLIGPGDGDDTVDLTGGDGMIISSVYGETIDGDGGADTVENALAVRREYSQSMLFSRDRSVALVRCRQARRA